MGAKQRKTSLEKLRTKTAGISVFSVSDPTWNSYPVFVAHLQNFQKSPISSWMNDGIKKQAPENALNNRPRNGRFFIAEGKKKTAGPLSWRKVKNHQSFILLHERHDFSKSGLTPSQNFYEYTKCMESNDKMRSKT